MPSTCSKAAHDSARLHDLKWKSLIPGRSAVVDFKDGSPIELHVSRSCPLCGGSMTRVTYLTALPVAVTS